MAVTALIAKIASGHMENEMAVVFDSDYCRY